MRAYGYNGDYTTLSLAGGFCVPTTWNLWKVFLVGSCGDACWKWRFRRVYATMIWTASLTGFQRCGSTSTSSLKLTVHQMSLLVRNPQSAEYIYLIGHYHIYYASKVKHLVLTGFHEKTW